MKSALAKNTVRDITKSFSRFLSIFIIIALGVGFFAGIKVSAPDMKMSADTYYKQQNLAHFRLVSTYGFNDDDIKALSEIEGVTAYPGYFTDVLLQQENSQPAARVFSLKTMGENNEVNSLVLEEGRFPEAANECLADSGSLLASNKVGDKIKLSSGTDDPLTDTLKNTEFTIVGVFQSPVYIDKSARGSTTVGNGSIKNVLYIPEENFLTEVYTEVYLTCEGLDGTTAYYDEYEAENDRMTEIVEAVGDSRRDLRYEEIITEAEQKISDGENELAEKKAEAEQELADAKAKLDEAADEIEKGRQELADARKTLDETKEQLETGRGNLDYAWVQYKAGREEFYDRISKAETELSMKEKEFSEKEKEYNEALAQFNEKKAQYEAGVARYEQGLAEYEKNYGMYRLLLGIVSGTLTPEQLAAAAEQYPELFAPDDEGTMPQLPGEEELAAMGAQLEAAKAQLDAAKAELDEAKPQIEAGEKQINEAGALIEDGRKQLETGKAELEKAKTDGTAELESNYDILNEQEIAYRDGVEKYRQGEVDYAQATVDFHKGEDEYKEGLADYEKGKAEADEKIADAEKKLKSAKRDLEKLENPKWYIFDRSSNPGYTEYGQNADRVGNIANVFPVFFLLVAALVCLTTMTRMVEEQRTQIGTLKALGYKNRSIIGKFLIYALTATALGAAFGAGGGQKLLPMAIMGAYGMLYSMPVAIAPIDWLLSLISLAVAMVLVTLTVYSVCRKELASCPAQLMRPKAPRAGKRILLERTPLWKHMGFNSKVTWRNLFRYKRRMLMTVIGVAGCTALLMAGFGIHDSISEIVYKQYSELNVYDGMLMTDSKYGSAETSDILDVINEKGSSAVLYQKQITAQSDSASMSVYLVVGQNMDELEQFYVFRDRKTHEPKKLQSGSVLLSEKLSTMLGISKGDSFTLFSSETEPKTVVMGDVFENYPQHYVFMTEEDYELLFGEKPDYNLIAFDCGSADKEELAQRLMDMDGVVGISFTADISSTFDTMLQALNSIIYIIILCSGALAFVVLYNLTNININERIREIATLKVLGFTNGEVDSYIFRESLLLSFMGTLVGLFGGTFLSNYIISTVEIDVVMFGRDIAPLSYLFAAVITMAFSLAVSLYMHRYLTRIDMIEALKSVE